LNRTLHIYLLRGCLLAFTISIFFTDAVVKAQNSSGNSTANITWTTERLDKGIYWKNYKGDQLFDSRQNINLVELFLDSVETEFELAFLKDSLAKTSEFASKNDALIAVNGSFFNRESGGSVVFLKVDGTVIHQGHVNRNPFNERGAVGWSDNQPIQILKRPNAGWNSTNFENVMSSGPLLIYESEIQSFNNNSFHQNRHPRTAVAITNDKRLFLVTIDGRSFQAYGMTIPELTNFLKDIGAKDALNLDGGGSTAMWIKNKTENGIVNYPSDNFQFDHEGERDVANALLIVSSEE
jgi:exopolysaccharide biosynthesis protein